MFGRCVLPVATALALVAVPAVSAGAVKQPPYRVLYGGTTSQENPFVLKLDKGARTVDRASLYADGTCAGGSAIALWATLRFEADAPAASPVGVHVVTGDRVSSSGSFSAAGSGVDDFGTATGTIAHTIKGKVRRNGSASGTYRAKIVLRDKATGAEVDTCDTGTFRWSGRSARGRVYAGATSQGAPMVVELDKARRAVADVHFGWQGQCTPPGTWSLGDQLSDFRIANGRFGDTFTNTYDTGGGEKVDVDYAIDGRLSRSKVSGSFSVRFARTDAAGAVTQDCDSGKVSWSLPTT